MKSITRNWNGKELRETCLHYPDGSTVKRIRIVTGLKNGGSVDGVYVWGDNGWNFLMGRDDLDVVLPNVSYISAQSDRKTYAEQLNEYLKTAVKNLFI